MRRIVPSLALVAAVVGPARTSGAATAGGDQPVEAATPPVETATPSAAASPSVSELQAMHAEAQQRVERYNATHEASHLEAARELLGRWLVAHRERYGDGPEAMSVRAPVEQQLGMIDAELLRVGAPSTPAVAPAPAPAPAPRPAMTPDQATRMRRSGALLTAGVTSFAIGGVTLLAVSLPLWALRNRALERADRQELYVDELRYLSRARRRQAGAIATFVVGTALAGTGVAMMTVGGIGRLRVRRELAIVPELGPGFAGASATLRF